MFVDHVTDVTPTLSLAVPLNAIVADVVEIEVAPGDAIVNVGGVVSVPPLVGGAGEAAACLVTVTTCDTVLVPAVAFTVIVFTPVASARFEIVQALEPAALPDAALVDQVTEIAPEPPDAPPDRLTVEAVVAAAVELTFSVKGPAVGVGVGVGVGAGVVELPCAA